MTEVYDILYVAIPGHTRASDRATRVSENPTRVLQRTVLFTLQKLYANMVAQVFNRTLEPLEFL